MELDRYCPTVVNVVLQIASSELMPGSCGDLKQAFMQSGPLTRAQGVMPATRRTSRPSEGPADQVAHGAW